MTRLEVDQSAFSEPVSKISRGGAVALALGSAAAGNYAGYVAASEASRPLYNRYGAHIAPFESAIHPLRVGHKKDAAASHLRYKMAMKAADRREARAGRTSDPVKTQRLQGKAEKKRARANVWAYNTQRHEKSSRGKLTGAYNPGRTYTPPANMSKSDRRMKPETAQWAGRLPKHSEGAAFLRASAARGKLTPLGLKVGSLIKAAEPAGLPGDNRDAEMARSRRKTGLGVAGAGYLLASRAKDVAPGAADLLVKSPKKLGAAKHAEKVLALSKPIARHAGRVGAALVGGGLVLAGEGAVSDLRNRKAFSRTHTQVKEKLHKSAFGVEHHDVAKGILGNVVGAGKTVARLHPIAAGAVGGAAVGGALGLADKHKGTAGALLGAGLGAAALTRGGGSSTMRALTAATKPRVVPSTRVVPAAIGKAYESGAITLHQEQAQLHARKKTAANQRIRGGVVTAAGGLAVGRGVQRYAPQIGEMIAGNGRTGDEVYQRAKVVRRVRLAGGRGGLGVAAAGLTVAGAGIGQHAWHAKQQNKETQQAQLARKSRNASLAKAFDSERSRHGRQDMYSGAATGLGVVAGAGAVKTGLSARAARTAGAAETLAAEGKHQSARDTLSTIKPSVPGGTAVQLEHRNRTARAAAGKAFRLDEEAMEHGANAVTFGAKAKKLTLKSRGSAVGALALGGAAYGLHNYDRRRGGKSY